MGRSVKGLAFSVAVSTTVMAGGYKIPEQSLNSMALGAAYVAHTTGADTAYFNPANMVFMGDKQYIESAITLAHLSSNVYTLGGPASGKSKVENLLIPTMHYIAPALGNFRWGASLTVPGGLTKRWNTAYQKAFAEEFTLKIIELNPSFAYKVAENFALGGGLRLIYSEGIVKSDSARGGRDMKGDTLEFGYNLALAYKPTADMNFAVTYRSNVDLNEEGSASLYGATRPNAKFYDGDASVEVPLPAALNIAISKTWEERLTLEFNYERTFWSTYETLDFKYTGTNNASIPKAFRSSAREWKDTNTFRIGATVKMNNKFTAMMGFSIDETPSPIKNIGFELPDSDAKIFTMGFRYQQSEDLSWGAAFLYDSKEAITIPRGINENAVLTNGGGFSEGGAFLTTVGVAYEF